jgi:branched-chain amino acid transport system permease protein
MIAALSVCRARWRTAARAAVGPAVVLVCVIGIGLGARGPLTETITEMMIRMVIVVGLYVFVGNSGIISFGHISFMAIGAYAAAWLTCCTLPMVKPLYLPGLPELLQNTSEPFWTGLAAAVLLSAIVAGVVGYAIMRLSGIAASIATFGILAVEFNIYSNWDSMTAGTSSISNIPISIGPLSASLFAAAAIVVAALYQNSRFGVALRAARDDLAASKAAGIHVVHARLVAFVLSAAIVGLGGALQSGFLGTLTVDTFYFQLTFLTLSMLIVGGMSSLTGAIVGVLLVSGATIGLRGLEAGVTLGAVKIHPPSGFQEVVLGVAMVLFMILRPAGATKSFDVFRFPVIRHKS